MPSSQGPARGAAAQRRAALAKRRRQRQTLLAGAATAAVVAIVAVFVVVKVSGGGKAAAQHPGSQASVPVLPAALYRTYTSVPTATLAAAAANYRTSYTAYPRVTDDPPTAPGATRPEILYIGAEFCPYCATERWPLVLALSKFGTFTNLHVIHSDDSAGEEFREVPTFSFYGSTYTSPYLTFTPIEETTENQDTVLQTPTKAEEALIDKYDPPSGDIPFVYFDGKAVLSGAEYDPQLLIGRTVAENIASIVAGTSPLASSVDSNAGTIVSDICHMTGGRPGNVCRAFPKPITG